MIGSCFDYDIIFNVVSVPKGHYLSQNYDRSISWPLDRLASHSPQPHLSCTGMASIYEADPNVVMVDGTFYNTKVEPAEPRAERATVRRRKFCRTAVVTQEAALAQPNTLMTNDTNFGVGDTGPLRDMVSRMHKHLAGAASL